MGDVKVMLGVQGLGLLPKICASLFEGPIETTISGSVWACCRGGMGCERKIRKVPNALSLDASANLTPLRSVHEEYSVRDSVEPVDSRQYGVRRLGFRIKRCFFWLCGHVCPYVHDLPSLKPWQNQGQKP